MRTINLAKMGIGLLMSSTIVLASDNSINIENTDVYKLTSHSPTLIVKLSGLGTDDSGLCGVEIRASSWARQKPIEAFLGAIKITGGFFHEAPRVVVKNATTISIGLSGPGFITGFKIETMSGESLDQVIEKTLGQSRLVVIMGSSCGDTPPT